MQRIEQYIRDYEEGKITVAEIAKMESVGKDTIYKTIRNYYNENRKEKT